jgi:hypothetical protein
MTSRTPPACCPAAAPPRPGCAWRVRRRSPAVCTPGGSAPGPARCCAGCERPGHVKCSPSVLLLISRSYAFTSSDPTVRATPSSRHSCHSDGSGAAAGPGRRGRWLEGVR